MNLARPPHLLWKYKACLVAVILLFVHFRSLGQACDCPALDTCGPCEGGAISLILEYTGGALLNTIEARDGEGNYLGSSSGTILTINSVGYPNVPFGGGEVIVTANFLLLLPTSETINTSCGNLYEGSQYGDFIVLGGESLDGGTLCCAEADMETNPPILSGCPSDISIASSTTVCSTSVTWTEPTATDDCGNVVLTSTHEPGDTFQVGTTTVIYTATDDYNNTSTCSFDVVVSDETDPVLSCPGDQTLSADVNCEAILPDYTGIATFSDNCSVSVTQSPAPGSTLAFGSTNVTLTATDGAGNTRNCTFNVNVEDTTGPIITSCQADISRNLTADCNYVLEDFTAALTATDNCAPGDITFSQAPAAGTKLPQTGTPHLITLTATDKYGNATDCTFEITLKDVTYPVITCPGDQTLSADVNCEATLPDYTGDATYSDNCSVSVTQSPVAGSMISFGTTAVTLTATDGEGNTKTCTFNVNVEDDTGPVFASCQPDVSRALTADCSYVLEDFSKGVTAIDNCSSPDYITYSQSPPAGTALSVGVTSVTLTATDGAGNPGTCTFEVTVKDEAAPVISGCPAAITVPLGASECSKTIEWSPPSATDNCGSVNWTSSHNTGDVFSPGTTTVTYTATDEEGNQSTCNFDVTVIDDTKPVITGCKNGTIIEVTADESCEAVVSWPGPAATDNCNFTFTSNYDPGDVFPLGTTTVIYTATDDSDNVSTCDFKVIVKDKTAPVISDCITSDIVATADVSCETTVTWTPPTATDNCGVVTMTSSHAPGDTFYVGTTPVIYTATDGFGNASTCTFDVVVKDETDPAITCNSPVTAVADASCEAIVTWDLPLATDNCGTVNLTSSHHPGEVFPLGTTVVTYTATDGAGNSAMCSFDVIVSDETGPVFTNCMDVVAVAQGSCEAEVRWTIPDPVDNCGTATLTGSSHNPGDVFPVGITAVTYTAVDNLGNTSTCQFNVVVGNGNPPAISGCPDDITAEADVSGKVQVDWLPPVAEVKCGDVSLRSSHEPGDYFTVGTTEVVYEASDVAGNSTLCKFRVIVSYEKIHFDIAKVITPDGDGINDKWILSDIQKYQDNKVTIVDRWGSLIFSASGYNNENVVWKGVNRSGVLVPAGTYFYTISVRFASDLVEKTGFIELVR